MDKRTFYRIFRILMVLFLVQISCDSSAPPTSETQLGRESRLTEAESTLKQTSSTLEPLVTQSPTPPLELVVEEPSEELSAEPTTALTPTSSPPLKSTATQVPSPTKHPTQEPSPTPISIEASSSVIDLTRILLVVPGGGGGGGPCFESGSPEIHLLPKELWEILSMCIMNFPEGGITINFYDPLGKLAVEKQIISEPVEEYTRAWVNIWTPTTLLQGEWRVVASNGNISTEQIIGFNHPEISILNHIPSKVDHPLMESPSRPQFSTGEQLVLHGINFKPGSTLQLGVYTIPDYQINIDGVALLVDERTVNTDESGQLFAGITISSSYRSGDYRILYSYENLSDKISYEKMIEYPHFSVMNKSDRWSACLNIYQSRLRVGDTARVGLNPPLANNVRAKPNSDGNLRGKIEPGDGMLIMAGPYCNENRVWWYVYEHDGSVTGFTAEGDANNYWLEPEK